MFTITNIINISVIKKEMATLRNDVTAIHFPAKEVRELSKKLKESVAVLKQAIANKVLHHYHVHKIIFIAAGLFIVVCLLSVA